jgi:PncC family amidohydrolase
MDRVVNEFDWILNDESDQLPQKVAVAVADAIAKKQMRVASCEGVSGGLVAAVLQSFGATRPFYVGGCICPSLGSLSKVLGMDAKTLSLYGVSETTAADVLRSFRKWISADIYVANLGIVPTESPLPRTDNAGTVFLMLDVAGRPTIKRFQWAGDVMDLQSKATLSTLHYLQQHLCSDQLNEKEFENG